MELPPYYREPFTIAITRSFSPISQRGTSQGDHSLDGDHAEIDSRSIDRRSGQANETPGPEGLSIFISFVRSRQNGQRTNGWLRVRAHDFQPNWQANTLQRMQISRTICQSSRCRCTLLRLGDTLIDNHLLSRPLPPPFLAFFLFSIHLPSATHDSSQQTPCPSDRPPSCPLLPLCPAYSVTIKTPSVDSRYLRPLTCIPPFLRSFYFFSISPFVGRGLKFDEASSRGLPQEVGVGTTLQVN